MEGELRTLERRTVQIAALAVKTSVTAQMAAAGVQNGKLRGVGKKGAKVGVRYDLLGNTALVRATGPFHLLERDTKPHRIGQQKSLSGLPLVNASGQDIRKRYAVIPGVGVRAWANHPGTKGKHPWEKGVIGAVPAAEKAQSVALYQTLQKAYG
jgi:hypothetical protein